MRIQEGLDRSDLHFVGSLVPAHFPGLLALPPEKFQPLNDPRLKPIPALRLTRQVWDRNAPWWLPSARNSSPMYGSPERSRNIVTGHPLPFGRTRPGQEYAHGSGAQVRSHANAFAHVKNLHLEMLSDGAGEVVVGGDAVDFHALAVGDAAQFAAAGRRHVDVAMWPLDVDLHSVIAIVAPAPQDSLEQRRVAAVPDAQKGNGVKPPRDARFAGTGVIAGDSEAFAYRIQHGTPGDVAASS